MADQNFERPGAHGEKDIEPKAFLWIGIAFVLAAVVIHFGIWGLFDAFRSSERAKDDPALSLVEQQRAREPMNPVLQDGIESLTPVDEMRDWRNEEANRLEEYGWVDRENGVVRIPVDRALILMAQRGLPHREAALRDEGNQSSVVVEGSPDGGDHGGGQQP